MSTRSEPGIAALRRMAEHLAASRHERATTGHLLVAIAATPGIAADLLIERRLDREVLLKAARVGHDDAKDAIDRAAQRAAEFAARSASGLGPIHLLFALCQERSSAAYRTIEQCGADVGKLRTAAMQIAMGVVGRRATELPKRSSPGAAAEATGRGGPARSLSNAPVRRTPPMEQRPSPTIAPTTIVHRPSPSAPPPQVLKKRLRTEPPSRQVAPKQAAKRASRFDLDPKTTPLLCQIGRNLSLAAERGELDAVVGREAEIERTLDVLAKRQANSPCLIGAAGVGKTSVVRGVALRIASGSVHAASVEESIIVEIECALLLAGTGARGALAEKLAQLRAEVERTNGRAILFFDEIYALFSADAGDEAASEIKQALAKGEMCCLGTSTIEEYKRFILSDPGLARRFTPIEIEELSPADALAALGKIAPAFEKHHRTKYLPEAIEASVEWSIRYLPEKSLPDKAIGVLDLAGARARRRRIGEVDSEQIADVMADLAGVPKERLLETDGDRMLRLEELMAERIVGHKASIARIAAVLKRNASGFRSTRPIGSFLLLGPTGVGKTETAKAIAQCLFHSPHAMTRLDLSEYAESHAIARLVGSPPGYVGHDAGGQLTEAVRKRPYQVILLDEIEKAHRDVLEAFLQVFDEGRLTDGRGRTVDFSNTVIVLTSNLGAAALNQSRSSERIGFNSVEGARESKETERVINAARAALPPELYNRFDEVLVYASLSRADVAAIAKRLLRALHDEVAASRGVRVEFSSQVIDIILDSGGFDPDFGARPVRRTISRLIETPIAEMILRGQLKRGNVAKVGVTDGAITITASEGRLRSKAQPQSTARR